MEIVTVMIKTIYKLDDHIYYFENIAHVYCCIISHFIVSIYKYRYRGNNGNGKGGFDSLNNNEQVFIANPTLQKYQVWYVHLFSGTFLIPENMLLSVLRNIPLP